MNSMHVLGRSGDTQTRWDPRDPKSTQKARHRFETYRQAGFLAFSASAPGAEAVQVRAFDPQAKEILVTRPLIGG
jgi:hypothetical protein